MPPTNAQVAASESYKNPTFASQMKSPSQPRRPKADARPGCQACSPVRNSNRQVFSTRNANILDRFSTKAAAKRLAPPSTPNEIAFKSDSEVVSPMTTVCTPIESVCSSTASASTNETSDSSLPTTPAILNEQVPIVSNVKPRRLNTATAITEEDYDSHLELDELTDSIKSGAYEELILKAYRNTPDIGEEEECKKQAPVEDELPGLASAVKAIKNFAWDDQLPLKTPFVERSHRTASLTPRRLEDLSDAETNRISSYDVGEPPAMDNGEGRATLSSIPEIDLLNDPSPVDMRAYRRILAENQRLHAENQRLKLSEIENRQLHHENELLKREVAELKQQQPQNSTK